MENVAFYGTPMCFTTAYLQLFMPFVILRDNVCQIMPRAFCWSHTESFAASFIHTVLGLPSCISSRALYAVEICKAQWNFYQLAGGQIFCSEMTSAAGILTTATMFVTLTDSLLWTCNSFLQARIGHIDSTVSVMCSHYSTRQEIIRSNQWLQICPIEKLQPSR